MADQPGVAQVGQRAEVLGDRVQPGQAQVHHVEMVAAELAQVLLDLAAQLVRGGLGQPVAGRIPARADLGGDDQVVGVGGQRAVDQLVGRAQRGEVERGGVDVVHAELDRAAQHADRLVTVAGDGPGANAAPRCVRRIAPNPIRLTVRSPSVQVPAAAAPPVSQATVGVCHTLTCNAVRAVKLGPGSMERRSQRVLSRRRLRIP